LHINHLKLLARVACDKKAGRSGGGGGFSDSNHEREQHIHRVQSRGKINKTAKK